MPSSRCYQLASILLLFQLGFAQACAAGQSIAPARSAPSLSRKASVGHLAPVNFTNDVEPVLTKIGCNKGACHGSQSGKGGFKLSLAGFDSDLDYINVSNEAGGRRISVTDPAHSLLLLKPTQQLPHGGGPCLTVGSAEYNLLLRWIQKRAPRPQEKDAHLTSLIIAPDEIVLPRAALRQPLRTTAHYSDGTARDVTTLARYQSQNDAVASVDSRGTITTKQPGECAIMISFGGEVKVARITVPYPNPALNTSGLPRANYIDALVYQKLAKVHVMPSPRSTDAEFLRRVSLDVLATLPTPEETRLFLADRDPSKRMKLVDRLLDRPEYVDYRTLKLADLLRVNGQYCSEEGADVYSRWIHDQVQKNIGYDQFVRDLLTGHGSGFHVGPANFFKVATTPEQLAETTAQSFLGVRLQCAKCHNHPFEKWKQTDYYGLSAFFARVGQKDGPEFGETQIYVRRDGEVSHPRTRQTVAPKFLGDSQPLVSEEQDRREVLAKWLTSPDNKVFARVAVNRLWSDYFGKGIVDAVDDFRVSNPPSNPALLDALANDFIQHKYDIRYMTRVILQSEAYQRSSIILKGNAKDERNFARAYPRRLPAEPMMDAIAQVTARPDRFGAYPRGWRAIQLRDSRIDSYFLSVFGRPKREILCACERSLQPNLSQSLHLINSDSLNSKLSDDGGRVATLLKQYEKTAPEAANRRIVDELYLLTLCRYPTQFEAQNLLAHVAGTKEPRKAFEDSLWALLNSEEFTFNH